MTCPDAEKLYQWAAGRCARKEYCRSELLRKLLEKGLRRTEADAVLVRLESKGFVDERRYARAFVHDKTLFDRWGRLKTRQALRLKGIAEDIAEEALGQIDPAAYRDTLMRLLREKRRTLAAATPYELRGKLLRFAAGRGYEPQLIFDVLDELSDVPGEES